MTWLKFRWWVVRWRLRCKWRYGRVPWSGFGCLREYFDEDWTPRDAIYEEESYWEP